MIAQLDVEHITLGISRGKISLRPVGREPLSYQWRAPPGVDLGDVSGSEIGVENPGRYFVTATDADGAVASAYADVRLNLPDAILITGYQTSSCSHGTARDGSVRAEGHNFEKCNRWLWTSGVETTVPVLKNAALGVYTATPIAENGFEPLKFVSVAPPAQVLSESI
jgi:hypothetical protein